MRNKEILLSVSRFEVYRKAIILNLVNEMKKISMNSSALLVV